MSVNATVSNNRTAVNVVLAILAILLIVFGIRTLGKQ